jgi:protocatechuate 3,4-dioxygenase beta subunit
MRRVTADIALRTPDCPQHSLRMRRRTLALLGTSVALLAARRGTSFAADAPLPACIARPRQTEGPFFVDGDLERSDLRSDPRTGAVKAGAPLRLAFRVSRVDHASCTPFAGAQVHVWHCDAAGNYSTVSDRRGSTASPPSIPAGIGVAQYTCISRSARRKDEVRPTSRRSSISTMR